MDEPKTQETQESIPESLQPPASSNVNSRPSWLFSQKGVLAIFFLLIIVFVSFQYLQYNQSPASCGGDWNYGVKCPLGTSCRSLNKGPLAGGLCQPYLSPVFDRFFSKGIFCTMDVRECPDGTFVGRVPPNCEFTPCPGPANDSVAPTGIPNDDSFKKEDASRNAITKNDSTKKGFVNEVISLIKQYYAQNGTYPKELVDLRSEFTIGDEELRLYSNPPFYFSSTGDTYRYYAKLNTGEIFEGDPVEINKRLDASVRAELNNIVTVVILYNYDTKRLPKNLEEILTDPDLAFFKLKNNPFTGRPYTYTPKGDDSGFSVSGILSDGTEYKRDEMVNTGQ